MTRHQQLAERYEALSGKPAPRGTSTMALQVMVNAEENAQFTFEYETSDMLFVGAHAAKHNLTVTEVRGNKVWLKGKLENHTKFSQTYNVVLV